METKLIKPIVRIGNSSGVILPRSWVNREARIELIAKRPSEILAETLNILEKEVLLKNVLGICLTGSYARKEDNLESDIDLIVITDNINKLIKKGKYEIIVISKENLIFSLKNNAFPLLPMLKESISLLNEPLINEFKNMSLTKKNIGRYIRETENSIKKVQYLIEMTKKVNEDKVDDSIAYSLILRLRGIYIIECLRKNKLWSNRGLIQKIKTISNSSLIYERYRYVKNEDGENKSRLSIGEAEKLLEYIKQKNGEQERWLKELKY